MVRESLRKIERDYEAQINWQSFVNLYKQRELDFSLKIPSGMDHQLISLGGAAANEIKRLCDRHRVAERQRSENALALIDAEIASIDHALQLKSTKTNQQKRDIKLRKRMKLQQAMESPSLEAGGGYRIYPMYFAPVIMQIGAQRSIVPMRYRLLPRSGLEVPTQYNVFNARRDSLRSARNWTPLFGRKHAIFPFERFFEWVERRESKIEISFSPDGYDGMWAASLYEEYQHPELGVIRSFAMVTDDPPEEVRSAGHDRCPVFLDRTLIDNWLIPDGQSLDQLDALLDHKQRTYYSHALAA